MSGVGAARGFFSPMRMREGDDDHAGMARLIGI